MACLCIASISVGMNSPHTAHSAVPIGDSACQLERGWPFLCFSATVSVLSSGASRLPAISSRIIELKVSAAAAMSEPSAAQRALAMPEIVKEVMGWVALDPCS